MSSAMQEKSKRSVVFAVVAVVALGSTIASTGFGRAAERKLGETQARLLGGASKNAGEDAPTHAMPELRLGAQDLELAKTRDRDGAVSALVRVLERADRVARGPALISSVVAAKLFDGVAERVDAEPALLDDARLAVAIRRASFASSRRPLEGERRFALRLLSRVPSQVPIRTAGLAESTTAQAMEDVNAALHEMEDSAVAGDMKQCEDAALKPQGLAGQVTVGPSICKSARHVVESGERFQRLRDRAAAHARRSPTKTARVPATL
jgi:hypothetical protein